MREALCLLFGGHYWRATKWVRGAKSYGWQRVKHCCLCHKEERERVFTGNNLRPLDIV